MTQRVLLSSGKPPMQTVITQLGYQGGARDCQKPCSSHLLALQGRHNLPLSLRYRSVPFAEDVFPVRWYSCHHMCVWEAQNCPKDQRLASLEAEQEGQLHVSLLWSTRPHERVNNHESNPSRMKRLAQTLMRLLLGQLLACLKLWNFPCPPPAQQCNN